MKTAFSLAAALFAGLAAPAFAADTSLEALKDRVVGRWVSIACELRPTRQPDGGLAPTFLTRDFTYDAKGGFVAEISTFADPVCSVPLVTFSFAGEIAWHGENPAADGAYSQDYILSKALSITPKADAFADQLNLMPEGSCGTGAFAVGESKDILGKPCNLVTLLEGNAFVVDHDLLYVREDTPNMLFMGGKHVDGTGFYAPENRPIVGLQQPLIKVE